MRHKIRQCQRHKMSSDQFGLPVREARGVQLTSDYLEAETEQNVSWKLDSSRLFFQPDKIRNFNSLK